MFSRYRQQRFFGSFSKFFAAKFHVHLPSFRALALILILELIFIYRKLTFNAVSSVCFATVRLFAVSWAEFTLRRVCFASS